MIPRSLVIRKIPGHTRADRTDLLNMRIFKKPSGLERSPFHIYPAAIIFGSICLKYVWYICRVGGWEGSRGKKNGREQIREYLFVGLAPLRCAAIQVSRKVGAGFQIRNLNKNNVALERKKRSAKN